MARQNGTIRYDDSIAATRCDGLFLSSSSLSYFLNIISGFRFVFLCFSLFCEMCDSVTGGCCPQLCFGSRWITTHTHSHAPKSYISRQSPVTIKSSQPKISRFHLIFIVWLFVCAVRAKPKWSPGSGSFVSCVREREREQSILIWNFFLVFVHSIQLAIASLPGIARRHSSIVLFTSSIRIVFATKWH